ncbi:hypothetical protein NC652_023633 [Populus alba x Populus x berolinensis]|nr:hypothetical protein NC652_023633 [Populus alba x Populus x berolinensis]
MDNWGHCIWDLGFPNIPHRKQGKSPISKCSIYRQVNSVPQSSSRAVITERTILSPFTKEYRVHAANSGIL